MRATPGDIGEQSAEAWFAGVVVLCAQVSGVHARARLALQGELMLVRVCGGGAGEGRKGVKT
jgi:hypothetical protein